MSTATDDTLGDLFGPSHEADEPTPDDTPPEPAATLDERAFLLKCAATFDRWITQWTATGRDAEALVADLRVALTQSLIEHQRSAAP